MFRKKTEEKLDVTRLNEVVKSSRNLLNVLFIVAILVLIVLLTYLMKSWKILEIFKTLLLVISPVFIGLLIAWLFDPIVSFLKKKKINRVFGSIIVYVVFLGGIYLVVSLMIPALSEQINDFVSSIPAVLNSLKDVVKDVFDRLGDMTNYDLASTQTQILKSIEEFGISLATRLPELTVNLLKSILSGGMTIVLGFMFGFYMLIDFNNVWKHFMNILPKKWHQDAEVLTAKLNHSLRDFVQGTLLIMLIVFVAQSIGLTLAGLKAPLLFGLFCAITNIIPYLGPYIGGAPAVIVGFSISPTTGIFSLISIVAVQLIESNFLQPIVMGKAMKLHPVTIMVGLLIFQHFFGIIGMLLATPVISCLKVLIQFVNSKLDLLGMIKKEEKEAVFETE